MSITKDFERREMNGRQASQVFYWPADVKQLLAHARALEDMLRKHQWSDEGVFCPECGYWKPGSKVSHVGHSPDCALAKLLED